MCAVEREKTTHFKRRVQMTISPHTAVYRILENEGTPVYDTQKKSKEFAYGFVFKRFQYKAEHFAILCPFNYLKCYRFQRK